MKFSEFIDVRDGTHDSPKRVNVGKKLITTKNLEDNRIDFTNAKNISLNDFKRINERSKVDQFDILLSMIGTVGNVYQERAVFPDYAIKNLALLKFHGDELLSNWMNYYLQSKKGQSKIHQRLSGSTQQYISLTDLRNIEITLPDRDQMELCIKPLRYLDDLILKNNQINDNLQELRHILYKQLIAQSALKTISIKELYSIKYGKTLPKSQLLRTGTKVFGAKGFMGYTERKPLVNKATVTITSRGSGAGFVSYIDEEEAFLTNNLLYLIDKTGLGLSFTYELIKSSKPSQFVTGSAQPQLTINNLKQLKLKIPTDRFIIEQFKNNTKRIEDCMSNNKIENNSLQKLRLAFLNYYF